MSFTIGSLFDGSGGFPLAASLCGGIPKWASEVEPYPIAVTKSRFPDVKHLGSVTDIKGGEVEPVDVITFGSPCQDLSVAGKRAGLKHEANGDDETTRSGLFMEAVRIIKEMREATNGVYPRFALWENVPGAFSSNKGEDFRIVLEELIKVVEPTAVMPEVPKAGWSYADSYCGDGWSIAYRVLDAQFWGVPQRRRRIYLVADFRGECAGKVSFEREGLRGYFETGGMPWQSLAGDVANCARAANSEGECVIAIDQRGGKSPTLRAEMHGNIPSVMEPIPIHDQATRFSGKRGDKSDGKGNGLGVGNPDDPMNTLTSGDRHAVCYSMKVIARNGKALLEQANPICASDYKDPDLVAYVDAVSLLGDKVAGTLMARDYKGIGRHDTLGSAVCIPTPIRYIVRRLTPTECARLQGFPDTWGHPDVKTELTDEEYQFWLNVRNTHAVIINNKDAKEYTKEQILKWYNGLHTDSSEYKMWGNGIALPNALYVMQGIAEVMAEDKVARRKWLMDLLGDCL